ncbi:hypothetical protein EV356DRAFT_501553 [Viridothelium virens]|uniref:Uncharacterized protein n=1 Tax=Viridothelium virens TaxID=1048519 RepID=A0A6A6H947_VIRVR|nr:hypothetical protein EV356DRAFT_501553 [Viridothelium virens]
MPSFNQTYVEQILQEAQKDVRHQPWKSSTVVNDNPTEDKVKIGTQSDVLTRFFGF